MDLVLTDPQQSKFALTSDPGVEYVHIILDDKYAVNINVFGDAFDFNDNYY